MAVPSASFLQLKWSNAEKSLPVRSAKDLSPFAAMKRMPNDDKR